MNERSSKYQDILFEVWEGANSRVVCAVLAVVVVGLLILGVWLVLKPINSWGAYAAFGGALLVQAREDRVRVYGNRIEERRADQLRKEVHFDRGPSYTFGFTASGNQHMLQVADQTGAKITFLTTLKEGAPPAGAQASVEQLCRLRDILQQAVEDNIELSLARSEPFKISSSWILYPDRVEISGNSVPWDQAFIECSNTTGGISISAKGRIVATRSLTDWNAIPASNAKLRRAASGGWI
jgi:hypothetical protein